MASGDPPVVGNPVDAFGTISIQAQPSGDPDNTLLVKVIQNKRLEITINKGDGTPPLNLQLERETWSMTIKEID